MAVATGYREKALQIKHMQDSIFGNFGKKEPNPTEVALIAQVISSEQMKEVEEEDMESMIENHVAELGERIDAMEERLTEYMEQSMQRLAMFFITRDDPSEKQEERKTTATNSQRV